MNEMWYLSSDLNAANNARLIELRAVVRSLTAEIDMLDKKLKGKESMVNMLLEFIKKIDISEALSDKSAFLAVVQTSRAAIGGANTKLCELRASRLQKK